jgi:hypothetical protein
VDVLAREDLMLHKLYANRLIDQADVAALLDLHWDELDQCYLRVWAEKLHLENPLAVALKRYHQSRG